MKGKKIISLFCSAALVALNALSPLGSLSAKADQTLVDVPKQDIEERQGDTIEIVTVGGYTELRPDTADIPEMPDVLKNREPKHHVFERNEDHSINFRGELIMPGDTFEIPNDITREMIYTTDFYGRSDVYVHKEDGKTEVYFGKFSPENYGIEVKGSVDIIGYDDYDSGEGTNLDGQHVEEKFFRTAKNNLNCPIIIGPTGGGGDGPYVFYEDHDQRRQHTDVGYTVLAPYYFLTYRFINDDNDYDYAAFDKLFWPAGEFDELEFPEYYWLTDIPYTLNVPNPRLEGRGFYKWNNYDWENFRGARTNIQEDYTALTVQWTYEEATNEGGYDHYALPDRFKDVNFCGAGDMYIMPTFEGNHRTIKFDGNGGTIKGRDSWLIEVNEVKREDEAKYGENGDSRIPDDGDFGFDINDYTPEKDGDTFLGWCADKDALYTTFVTKDSTVEAYRYFWENDEYGTFTDKYTSQKLYAKWGSGTQDSFEKNGWFISDDGILNIMNDEGALNWTKASKEDKTLAPKVKNVKLGYKEEKVTTLPAKFLSGCTGVTELVFDEPVSFTGYAFDDCPNLTDVTVNFPVQGTWFASNAYMGTNKDFTLHVPEEYYNDYKDALGEYSYLLDKPNGQRYPLTVNGVIVTDDNLEMNCGSGTAKFDPKTNTLTLNNAVLSTGLEPHFAKHYSENNPAAENSDEMKPSTTSAIVSYLDKLTVVIEGEVNVNTYVDNSYNSNHEELPAFINAEGDLELKGSGTLKATKNDASLQYKDSETMELVEYVGPGQVKAFVGGDMTMSDLSTVRLYANVKGNFKGEKAKIYGGLLNVNGDLEADELVVRDFVPPETDKMIAQELAAITECGSGKLELNKCDCQYTVIGGINQCEEINLINSTLTLAGQLKGGDNTKLNIRNSDMFIMGIDVQPTNISEDRITLTDAEIVMGGWADEENAVMIQAKKTGTSSVILGDVNSDGKVTAKDSMMIQRSAVNLVKLTDEQKKAADVDKNGKVTNADALSILRYTIKANVKYPIGKEITDEQVPDKYDGTFVAKGVTLKTLGDVYELNAETISRGFANKTFRWVLEDEEIAICVMAELPDDVYDRYKQLSFFDSDYDEQVKNTIKDVEITEVIDYKPGIPTQDELDKWVGKTGKELFDAGYENRGYMMTGDPTFIFTKGGYSFNVIFNEAVDSNMNLESPLTFYNMTVKSMTYSRLFV